MPTMHDSPIYLDSPQLFVTREHIISERASTSSSSGTSGAFGGSGESVELFGVGCFSTRGASLFSNVPRSLSSSSSFKSPESLSKDSIRPNRFSRPSIYLALCSVNYPEYFTDDFRSRPFGRISLLFHVREDALNFVADTVGTFWHPPVTLDLLFSANITSLPQLVNTELEH